MSLRMIAVLSLIGFAVINVLVVGWCAIGMWRRSRRSRPQPIDELRANVRERRESLQRAATTDYRRDGSGMDRMG